MGQGWGYGVEIRGSGVKNGAIGPRLVNLWPKMRHLSLRLGPPGPGLGAMGPRSRSLRLRLVALGPRLVKIRGYGAQSGGFGANPQSLRSWPRKPHS